MLPSGVSVRCHIFIVTPMNKNEIKHRFMEATNFPGVIGAIDGTHIPLLKPYEQEHNYFNRKGYHSKNVQIVCDFDLKILNVNARFGGAAHDSFIWRQSRVKTEMERCYNEGDRNTWLLGDSGYPQEPWLMTPFENPPPGTPQSLYNQSHSRTRNCVERCIGVLKGRFRCLLLERKMRYSPLKVGNIVIACAILHNICVNGQLPMDFDMPQYEEPNRHQNDNHFLHLEGVNARAHLLELYFN